MKNIMQLGFLFCFLWNAAPVSSQNTMFVCCRCAGKGIWVTKYLDAYNNMQVQTINCSTCEGTGVGTCDASKKGTPEKPFEPSGGTVTPDGYSGPSGDYFQYLTDCNRAGIRPLSPDDWKKAKLKKYRRVACTHYIPCQHPIPCTHLNFPGHPILGGYKHSNDGSYHVNDGTYHAYDVEEY